MTCWPCFGERFTVPVQMSTGSAKGGDGDSVVLLKLTTR